MDPVIASISLLISYFLGSISFARLVVKIWTGKDVTGFEVSVDGTDEKYKAISIGGNTVSTVLGSNGGGCGCIYNCHIVFFSCIKLDVVHAHTGAANHLQTRSCIENGSSYAGPATNDQAIIVPNDMDQVFCRDPILIIHFLRCAQDGLDESGQSICDQDFIVRHVDIFTDFKAVHGLSEEIIGPMT
jgi:hypothetical protein